MVKYLEIPMGAGEARLKVSKAVKNTRKHCEERLCAHMSRVPGLFWRTTVLADQYLLFFLWLLPVLWDFNVRITAGVMWYSAVTRR